MPPIVAIVERHPALASALRKLVLFARCVPIVLPCCDELPNMIERPTAVVVRFSNTMPNDSPRDGLRELAGPSWVVALTTTYADLEEARRLRCDIVLQAAQQNQALYEALRHVVEADRVGPLFVLG